MYTEEGYKNERENETQWRKDTQEYIDNEERKMKQLSLNLQVNIQLRIVESHSKELDEWISKRHYLGYCPPGAKLRLWVMEGNGPVGAMMFGRPSARPYDNGTVWELTRFVFVDETSQYIEGRSLAMARKYIRKHYPQVKGLVSYSNPAYDHHGIVYAADNWFQLGWTTGGTWDSKSHPNRKNKDTGRKQRWVRSI